MSKTKKSFKFNSLDLLIFAWEKRKILVLFSVLATVISIIASYQITELYKSTVVLYPASAASASKSLISQNYVHRQSFLELGDDDQTDQLLQILNSERIRNRIIEKYDLLKYYGIPADHKHKKYLLYEAFSKHVSFKRTKYSSALIEVMDENPEIAANIANDIAKLVDTCYVEMQKERTSEGLKAIESEIDYLHNHLKFLEDSMNIIRSYGVIEYEYQTKELTRGYAEAVLKNDTRAMNVIKSKLDVLAKYSTAYSSLYDQIGFGIDQLNVLNRKYSEARIDIKHLIPQKYVVSYAEQADKKSYPKKLFIVLQSVLATFFLTYLILLILNRVKKI